MSEFYVGLTLNLDMLDEHTADGAARRKALWLLHDEVASSEDVGNLQSLLSVLTVHCAKCGGHLVGTWMVDQRKLEVEDRRCGACGL